MKKFLSILITAIFLVSLCAFPALASENDLFEFFMNGFYSPQTQEDLINLMCVNNYQKSGNVVKNPADFTDDELSLLERICSDDDIIVDEIMPCLFGLYDFSQSASQSSVDMVLSHAMTGNPGICDEYGFNYVLDKYPGFNGFLKDRCFGLYWFMSALSFINEVYVVNNGEPIILVTLDENWAVLLNKNLDSVASASLGLFYEENESAMQEFLVVLEDFVGFMNRPENEHEKTSFVMMLDEKSIAGFIEVPEDYFGDNDETEGEGENEGENEGGESEGGTSSSDSKGGQSVNLGGGRGNDSSSNTNDTDNNTNDNTEPVTSVFNFTDLPSSHWAILYVQRLVSAGILSGMSPTVFAPDNNITREQFVKIIVESLGVYDNTAVCNFDDVPKNAWYYGYVASAVKLGIVNGISDSEFGSGKNITREDMAVLLDRASGISDKFTIRETSEEKSFSDEGLISDYAKDSVKKFVKGGIISGYDNGTFGPKNFATRAEAAKMIFMLLY